MSTIRNWKGTDVVQTTGQQELHEAGWLSVTVRRTNDNSRNVGVYGELDAVETVFTIKARIDPIESKLGGKMWIGLVDASTLPNVQKNDHWYTQKPNEAVSGYRVTTVHGDEIMLEPV